MRQNGATNLFLTPLLLLLLLLFSHQRASFASSRNSSLLRGKVALLRGKEPASGSPERKRKRKRKREGLFPCLVEKRQQDRRQTTRSKPLSHHSSLNSNQTKVSYYSFNFREEVGALLLLVSLSNQGIEKERRPENNTHFFLFFVDLFLSPFSADLKEKGFVIFGGSSAEKEKE